MVDGVWGAKQREYFFPFQEGSDTMDPEHWHDIVKNNGHMRIQSRLDYYICLIHFEFGKVRDLMGEVEHIHGGWNTRFDVFANI